MTLDSAKIRCPRGHWFNGPIDSRTATGTFTAIDVPSAGGLGTAAYGVSDHDQSVGLYFNGTGDHGFGFSPAG